MLDLPISGGERPSANLANLSLRQCLPFWLLELKHVPCSAGHVRCAQQVHRGSVGAGRGARRAAIRHLRCWSDTFPWRQPDFAKNMQIFAIDHPASLIESNRIFRERRFARPPNLIRVPLDLEQGRIEEQLAACDFDRDTATFCSALGLMLYLEDEVVG
jgi:hypothetical protein